MPLSRIARLAGFSLLVALSVAANAQTNQAEAEARLIGKPLYLRTPVAGEMLEFDADGVIRGHHDPVSFTEAGVDVSKVQYSGDRLTIEGIRMATGFDTKGEPYRLKMFVGNKKDEKPEKITIEVKNSGDADFGPALSAIFADGLIELAPSLPYYWQRFAKIHLLGQTVPLAPCTHPSRNSDSPCSGAGIFHVGGGVTPPKVLHSEDPAFSNTARRAKFSGNVAVYLVIDENGDPQNIQIQRPAGMGLDERAILAVSKFKFKPSMRDGKPVAVDMNIELNFQLL